jgi:hypothetical protein
VYVCMCHVSCTGIVCVEVATESSWGVRMWFVMDEKGKECVGEANGSLSADSVGKCEDMGGASSTRRELAVVEAVPPADHASIPADARVALSLAFSTVL